MYRQEVACSAQTMTAVQRRSIIQPYLAFKAKVPTSKAAKSCMISTNHHAQNHFGTVTNRATPQCLNRRVCTWSLHVHTWWAMEWTALLTNQFCVVFKIPSEEITDVWYLPIFYTNWLYQAERRIAGQWVNERFMSTKYGDPSEWHASVEKSMQWTYINSSVSAAFVG